MAESRYDQVVEKWEAAKRQAAGLREKMSAQAEEVIEVAATIGGGAAAGYIDREYGDKDFFGIKASIAAGVALTTVGVMDWAGSQSSTVGCVGVGMLAYEAGVYVFESPASDSSSGQIEGDEVGARRRRITRSEKTSAQQPMSADELRQLLGLRRAA